MAKGQVTEDDLAQSMKSLGGFGSLGADRARKDSPFRDSRIEEKTIEIPKLVEAAKPEPVRVLPDVLEEPAPTPRVAMPGLEPKPRPAKKVGAVTNRKADIYSERVTVQMSPEMRDGVDELARQLQRGKTSKVERITSNTVMRVAITFLLDHFAVKAGEAPNNERELLSLVESRLRTK